MPSSSPLPALTILTALALLAGCAAPAGVDGAAAASTRAGATALTPAQTVAAVNRVSWGINDSTWRQVRQHGYTVWLDRQLRAAPVVLPAAAQAQIDALTISNSPLPQLVARLEGQRKAADGLADDAEKKAAQQAYQKEMTRLAREAATRALLRDLYAPQQLQEQMIWFWMNHFSVHEGKSNLRILVGDYEESAIRPHALGRFRDLLGATVRHPAMIRYLDNEQNAAGRLNENYARELMELHTLGVDGGYSQRDVQELARILTGVGVNFGTAEPKLKPELRAQYLRQGLFEFNPNRHDYGAKQLLGQPIRSRGLAEVDEALDRLCRHPATARHVSRKLATYFVADEPPAALVQRMAATFQSSDGDIAAVLNTLFTAPEFVHSLGSKFKAPVQYVVAAVRLTYDDKVILNTGPMLGWLTRMAEPPYGRQTPDGYPLASAGWAGPGQMSTRFEIARAIGSGNAGLFKAEGPQAQERAAFPQLASAFYYQTLAATLGAGTRAALEQATSPQDWNTLLLSSPELMHR